MAKISARAPSGARTHFLVEARAKQAEARREANKAGLRKFGSKFAPMITRERMAREREMQAKRREETFKRAGETREALSKFVKWAREKLAPRRHEIEFGGVKLSHEESGALRNLVNQKRLSPREEQMVGEALEKLLRKQAVHSELKRQAV